MNFKYVNYTGFVKYCLGICRNKEYLPTNEEIYYLNKFNEIIEELNVLIKYNVIELYNNIYDSVINCFIVDPNKTFNSLKYMKNKLDKVKNKECNYYYFVTSLNTMLGIKAQFTYKFIKECSSNNIFYPSKIKVYVVKDKEVELSPIKKIDSEEYNRYGVYFIYNNEGILEYIGKSLNSVIKRSFQSAIERKLLDFSKIEYRYPKSKSDTSVYEAYYIAKYKPIKNNDFVYNDLLTIELPDLDVSYTIERDKDSLYTMNYLYYEERVVDIEEYLNSDNMYILNDNNKLYLENSGIYKKDEAYSKAHDKCLRLAKSQNRLLLSRNGLEGE